ncbi:MAG TPA: hypothetical protein VJ835_03640 [Fimbriimonadaceae bacterium]|nr:hypothetical protein [Fimbriimonadaceae bacterium]
MDTVTQGIDARQELVNWLHGVVHMTCADIMAVPEEKWTQSFGGCTRPTYELIADATAFANWIREALHGTFTPYDGSVINNMGEQMKTREAAVAKVKEVGASLAAAISEASIETLNKTVQVPWGEQKLYSLAQTAVSHFWYHDGQINYVQCLLGDEQVHWQ